MDPAQHQMQTALSAVVILAAAVAAFVCDLLRRNNQQLRELAIELKVRREEEEKRSKVQLAPYSPATRETCKPPAAPVNTPAAKVSTPAENAPARRPERRE